jgi:hypothetical protein
VNTSVASAVKFGFFYRKGIHKGRKENKAYRLQFKGGESQLEFSK